MLADRTLKARAAALFAKATFTRHTDKQTGAVIEQASKVTVPGSDLKIYDVILRRSRNSIEGECLLCVGNSGHDKCKGGVEGVCYHIMAAVIVAGKGYDVRFSNSGKSAANLRKLGYKLAKVVSRNCSGKYLWVAFKKG